MPSYLTPGVYVEEVSHGNKSIEGVGTSTAAFIGYAKRGPANKAMLVTSWNQYVQLFGGFHSEYFLAYSVFSFFNEGGRTCYVIRAFKPVGKKSEFAATKYLSKTEDVTEDDKPDENLLEISTFQGEDCRNVEALLSKGSKDDGTYMLSIKEKGEEKTYEVFSGLNFDNESDFDNNFVNSGYVFVKVLRKCAPELDEMVHFDLSDKEPAANHTDKDEITAADYVAFLKIFDIKDDINLLILPEAKGDEVTMIEGKNYCEGRKDLILIVDTEKNKSPEDVKGLCAKFNSSYAAAYYPWVWIMDPVSGEKKLIPPSGLVAGRYADTDIKRGVHKAPAGTYVGFLRGAVGVEKNLTKEEQAILNPKNINVIRSFPDSGICIWGARTLTTDAEFRYVNVRRLFMYLEESIEEGTQWVAFEPNNSKLWVQVLRNIHVFLTQVWLNGALPGSTTEEAFYIKVDEDNNPEDVRNAGQLIIEIGIAPIRPAEFVIFRISQKTQKSN